MLGSGTTQQVFEWGALNKNTWMKFGGWRHAWEFLFNFSKVMENAFITRKLLIFFHIFSNVAIGSENSPSLNWNILDWYHYWYQPLITINVWFQKISIPHYGGNWKFWGAGWVRGPGNSRWEGGGLDDKNHFPKESDFCVCNPIRTEMALIPSTLWPWRWLLAIWKKKL